MLYYIDLCNESVGKVLYYDYQISFECIFFSSFKGLFMSCAFVWLWFHLVVQLVKCLWGISYLFWDSSYLFCVESVTESRLIKALSSSHNHNVSWWKYVVLTIVVMWLDGDLLIYGPSLEWGPPQISIFTWDFPQLLPNIQLAPWCSLLLFLYEMVGQIGFIAFYILLSSVLLTNGIGFHLNNCLLF